MAGIMDEKRNSRETSIHEAGHAVMDWFHGQDHRIIKIDMRGNSSNHAFVRTQRTDGPSWINSAFANDAIFARSLAVRSIMVSLAGPAAQARYEMTQDEWFSDLFDEWIDEYEEPVCDMGQAVAAAKALHLPHGKRWHRFLKTVADWTFEAIEIPKVWTAIEALADRLQTVQTMKGSMASRIIERTSGNGWEMIPSLGRKWKRRCSR